jgi:hypothetical protein
VCWLCGERYSPGTLEASSDFGEATLAESPEPSPEALEATLAESPEPSPETLEATLAESPEPSPEPLVTHWFDFPLQTFPLIADLVVLFEVLHTLGRDGQV